VNFNHQELLETYRKILNFVPHDLNPVESQKECSQGRQFVHNIRNLKKTNNPNQPEFCSNVVITDDRPLNYLTYFTKFVVPKIENFHIFETCQ